MRALLATLHKAYDHAVDIEFTANFIHDTDYRINLVQCRPFKVRGSPGKIELPRGLPNERIIIRTAGPIIGNSLSTRIDRVVSVVPSAYGAMRLTDRYAVARLIGRITHLDGSKGAATIMLVGPGRWGTTTPALGVPVTFAEINTVSVLCEMALMHEGLVPDVSLGTHFFNDLVEMDMLYLAVYPHRKGHILNRRFLESAESSLEELLPDARGLAAAVKVIDGGKDGNPVIALGVDAMAQRGVCYMEKRAG
jgi:hypothetical protein